MASATMPSMKSLSLGVYLGVGGRYEMAEESGISHFLEHMLFKGTERRSVLDIAMEVEGSGGTLNAYTGEEYTCYEAKGPAELLSLMADVVTDMVLRPTFPPDELDRERDVVVEEITMYRENPSDYVHELASRALWGDHPLGRSLAGTEETLRAMDACMLREFHRRNYRTPAHILAVAGPQPHGEIVDLAARLYEGIEMDQPGPVSVPFNRGQYPSAGILHDQRDIEQSHFIMNYTTPGNKDPRRHAMRLLSIMLGETMSSRLFQEIREKRGLAYSIYSDIALYSDCGSFSIYAGVDSDKKNLAMDTIRTELSKILAQGCSAGELEQAKRFTLGQMTVMLDSTGGQLCWVGESVLNRGEITDPGETRDNINKVTVEDIAGAAELILKDREPTIAVVGK